MSAQTIRWLVPAALLVHGIGHTLGFWMPARSWLLLRANSSGLRVLSSIFWILSAIGFIASALGFWGWIVPSAWCSPLAILSAVLSLIGLVLFFGTWPAFNTVGAFGMNIAILATQLWLDWPPEELLPG